MRISSEITLGLTLTGTFSLSKFTSQIDDILTITGDDKGACRLKMTLQPAKDDILTITGTTGGGWP